MQKKILILKANNGTILIVSLWILVILTIFALALGQQASLKIKLAQYQRDVFKAVQLARAAVERAIWQKRNDDYEQVDALSESWANNHDQFKDFRLGDGVFTVSYPVDQVMLYGLEDEQAKINVNSVGDVGPVPVDALVNLLISSGTEEALAQQITASIIAWRSSQDFPDEDSYYQSLELPYPRKRANFSSIAELLLVRGVDRKILYGEDQDDDGKISREEEGLAKYLTVHGQGAVNINTASERVLTALMSSSHEGLVAKIIAYRMGDDGIIGTEDDRWFANEPDTPNSHIVDVCDLEAAHCKQAKNLAAAYVADPLFDVTPVEWRYLSLLAKGQIGLSVSSDTYTIHVQSEVEKVKQGINTTLGFSSPEGIKTLSWQRN